MLASICEMRGGGGGGGRASLLHRARALRVAVAESEAGARGTVRLVDHPPPFLGRRSDPWS